MAQFLLLFGVLLLVSISRGNQDFSYEGDHGPPHWGDTYHTCIGKHQSPINIDEHNVKNISLPTLKFSGLSIPRSSFLQNNGHTVMLKTNESKAAMVTGGPLGDSIYVFEQLHFHWGANDTQGSEDLINNHSFAMELHAVFYKKDYESMNAALEYPDGLTVLAYFYEASEMSNPTYKTIVDILPGLEKVGSNDALHEPLILDKLLIPNISTMEHYFTYNGSLTTPPCSEVVTWIDFKEPQLLSHEQLAAFRNVRTSDGTKLTHNFRPVQPLADRIVFQNIPFEGEPKGLPPGHHHHHHTHDHPEDPNSGQIGVHLSVLILFAALLLAI